MRLFHSILVKLHGMIYIDERVCVCVYVCKKSRDILIIHQRNHLQSHHHCYLCYSQKHDQMDQLSPFFQR